jgi:hypothetical protein
VASTRTHTHATKHLVSSSCTTMPTKPQSASPLRLAVHLRTKQAKTQTLTTRTITITELHDRDARGRGAAREMRDQGKRGARRAKDTDAGTGPGRQSETRGRARGVVY